MSFDPYLQQMMLLSTVAIPLTPCQVGLFTNDGATEVSGGAYGRFLMFFNISYPNPVTASNSTGVAWPLPTTDWGVVTHVGIFANDGVNLLFKKELLTPVHLKPGAVQFGIPSRALELGFV